MTRAAGRMAMGLLLLGTLVPAARGADESLVGSRVKAERGERAPAGGVPVGMGPRGLRAQVVVRF
jgi:hypothetical protein